jgi:hypothetical protein
MTAYESGGTGSEARAVLEIIEYKAAPRWIAQASLGIALLSLGMAIYFLLSSFDFLFNMLSMQAKIAPEFRRFSAEDIYTQFGKSALLALTNIGSAVFFALFSLRLLRHPGGRFSIGREGIHVDGIATGAEVSGLVGWNEVEKAGDAKLWSGFFDAKYFPTTFVGVKLRDPETFLDRALINVSAAQKLTAPIAGIAQKPLITFLSLFGISFPAPGDKSYFHWMREQTGYDLLLPKKHMKDPAKTLRLLQSLITDAAAQAAGTQHAGEKKCPMCAEYLKAEAKICRFCRYEFPA